MVEVVTIFLTSVASALIPLINIEAVLVAAAGGGFGGPWALVIAAGVGQMVGKVLWYWGGREVDRAPWVSRHLDKPKAKATLEKWHARAEGRPWFTTGLLLLSAAVGVPPYAVVAVLAGMLRVNFVVFLVTGLVGRIARFAVMVFGTTSVIGWF